MGPENRVKEIVMVPRKREPVVYDAKWPCGALNPPLMRSSCNPQRAQKIALILEGKLISRLDPAEALNWNNDWEGETRVDSPRRLFRETVAEGRIVRLVRENADNGILRLTSINTGNQVSEFVLDMHAGAIISMRVNGVWKNKTCRNGMVDSLLSFLQAEANSTSVV